MAAEQPKEISDREFFGACCCCLAILAGIASLIYLIVLLSISKHATYSVTVAGAAGLDPAADLSSAAALSPVFNLTFHIDNSRDRLSSACVTRFASAAVSYGDAFLAKGSVPQFCARPRKVRERGARAWGDGVALPRFLRGQLAREMAAGEAAVHVEVTMPGNGCDAFGCYDTVLICSDAKIGGGPARCREETVYHRHQQAEPAPGSTN
ncbi:unnamed protein product [Urochloa decumbens]|uniref:Late embryogenesis abundant protein LEA-2 subgroup domain-containing protein n=1 Tax=Urochloa decumbens TaxID=240449 RepID=A0ABC9F2Z3_9POAL